MMPFFAAISSADISFSLFSIIIYFAFHTTYYCFSFADAIFHYFFLISFIIFRYYFIVDYLFSDARRFIYYLRFFMPLIFSFSAIMPLICRFAFFHYVFRSFDDYSLSRFRWWFCFIRYAMPDDLLLLIDDDAILLMMIFSRCWYFSSPLLFFFRLLMIFIFIAFSDAHRCAFRFMYGHYCRLMPRCLIRFLILRWYDAYDIISRCIISMAYYFFIDIDIWHWLLFFISLFRHAAIISIRHYCRWCRWYFSLPLFRLLIYLLDYAIYAFFAIDICHTRLCLSFHWWCRCLLYIIILIIADFSMLLRFDISIIFHMLIFAFRYI